MITENKLGFYSNEKEVVKYTLSNGNMTAEILNLGCIVYSISVPDKNGKMKKVTLGYKTEKEYLNNDPGFGMVPGRSAGRIKSGYMVIEGKAYQLSKNDNGKNHLHGGINGFGSKVWDGKIVGDKLELSYLSVDGEENYPGNLNVKVVYYLDGESLNIEYFAETDKTTVINLTNHTYFKLSDEDTIYNTDFQLFADKMLVVDEELIPTGELRDIARTQLDMRKTREFGEILAKDDEHLKIAHGIDADFVISCDENEPCAIAYSPISGIELKAYTSFPIMHVYTGNYLKDAGFKHHGAFCLEAQKYSDSINNPLFPTSILKKGELYHFKTKFAFGVR